MKALVTGAAGFIGSHLSERLLRDGYEVTGVDSLFPTYDPRQRLANLAVLDRDDAFALVIDDLRTMDIATLLSEVDVVFHLAAIPGVRASWSRFPTYVEHNIMALQRLLDAIMQSEVRRLVWASSSSVYGETDHYPTRETDLARPHSPYGATKLAGEHLVGAYARNHGVDAVGLRYFSVYGPRQRPDMAVHRLCEAALGFGSFEVFGDGSQVRDMTFVNDVVEATILAATVATEPGSAINVAGGCVASLNEIIEEIGALAGHPLEVARGAFQAGDVTKTGGDTQLARRVLGWEPKSSLQAGLAAQFEWHQSRHAAGWYGA